MAIAKQANLYGFACFCGVATLGLGSDPARVSDGKDSGSWSCNVMKGRSL